MAFNIVRGEPTGMANPAPTAEVGPEASKPEPAAPMKPEAPHMEPSLPNHALAGMPGANPTANYRRFEMDGGEGSMGHHWEHLGGGKE